MVALNPFYLLALSFLRTIRSSILDSVQEANEVEAKVTRFVHAGLRIGHVAAVMVLGKCGMVGRQNTILERNM